MMTQESIGIAEQERMLDHLLGEKKRELHKLKISKAALIEDCVEECEMAQDLMLVLRRDIQI